MYVRLSALLLIAGALAAAATGASTPAPTAVVSASANGVTVIVPGQPSSVAAESVAPGASTSAVAEGVAYPADGSLVRTGALSTSAAAKAADGSAQAVVDVVSISLFNGEITAQSTAARAKASKQAADAAGSAVTNLVVLGQPVTPSPNLRLPLGDWGYLIVLEQVADAPVADGKRNARGAVNALHVVLTAAHGGHPAGTEILVGHAEAAATTAVDVRAPAPPTTTTAPPAKERPAGVPPKQKPAAPKEPKPEAVPGIGGPLFKSPPLDVSAPLSPAGYVFPVYGDASFGDTWHAPRATTGRHIGTDIFAALGAPILAVADGTVFSVGWNRVGGWRLWLRDRQGNQFYYAHLAAYTPLARDGAEVRAGQVLGFNGNTGDAQGTPYHVHFEIHPVGLLPFGYEDGAVNPYPYLTAWRRLTDVTFAVGRGWAPPVPATATAPRPGALLLGSRDISTVSGLQPGSLERALVLPVSTAG